MTTTDTDQTSPPTGPTILAPEPGQAIEPIPVLPVPDYEVDDRPIRGGRRDLTVKNHRGRDAATETDVVDNLRRFFMAVDQEATRYKNDPITNVQALAKLEALLADIRYLRNTVQGFVARAMQVQRIRVLTVEHVVTVEASTEAKRSGWKHDKLLGAVFSALGIRALTKDGEVLDAEALAALVLVFMRPEWRLTPLRDAGIDPDGYCTMEMDDSTDPPKPLRTPTLRMVSNRYR